MPTALLYRWEYGNRGLDHKCGTCATVLSNPRARKTCIGKHEEVCIRYHKTLFFIGQSNHCDACHKTIEQHEKRHREIAAFVQQIHALDMSANENSLLVRKRKKGKRRDDNSEDELTVNTDSCGDDANSEWNDSSTLHDDDAYTKPFMRSKVHNDLDEKNVTKDDRRMAKNQVRLNITVPSDLDDIRTALHPNTDAEMPKKVGDDQSLVNNITIKSNISFTRQRFRWSSVQQDPETKSAPNGRVSNQPGIDRGTAMQVEAEGDAIIQDALRRLKVATPLAKISKERKGLVGKLTTAIRADLIAHENEQVETMQRMAGYWRYVSRRTYNEMIRNNDLWDWATGEKMAEDDGEDLEDSMEDDEESLGGTTQVTTPASEREDAIKDLSNRGMQSPKERPSPFQLRKDNRSLARAIRAASPPRVPTPSPAPRYHIDKARIRKPTKAQPSSERDPKNRFGALNFEVPAPREDPQLAGTNDTPPRKSRVNLKANTNVSSKTSAKSFPALSSPIMATSSVAAPKPVKVLKTTAAIPQSAWEVKVLRMTRSLAEKSTSPGNVSWTAVLKPKKAVR